MQEGPICDICHIGPLRPHGFEQSSGFDRTEGDGKTTAWTNMTETSRDYLDVDDLFI